MKIWHKILLVSLILFFGALDVSVISLMEKSWQLNLQREEQRAISEQTLIANNIDENLNAIGSRGAVLNEKIYHDVLKSYASYYEGQGIDLVLFGDHEIIFKSKESILSILPKDTLSETTIQRRHYIQIAKKLPTPHENLTLVYLRNIQSLYEMQQNINHFFIVINFLVGTVLLALLYIVVRKITKPLSILSEITKQMADGNYSKRVTITSKDEIGELGSNFNKMAEAVGEQVKALSNMAEEKQRMVDNLAHELRTPLTSMQGFSEFLISANSSEEDKMLAAQHIKSETKRLSQLAFKLLEISTIQHNPLVFKKIAIRDLFEAVEKVEQQNLHNGMITLRKNIAIEFTSGDFDLLLSFLLNCVENAIHASRRGSEIVLSAYEQDNVVVLEVADSGFGMAKEEIEKAFEAFFRADKSRSRNRGGAGLGLSLCQQIAHIHHTTLNLQSEVGVGTTIQIFLQLHNNLQQTS